MIIPMYYNMFIIFSKILLSKQKIIDLFPKIERTLESIKEADSTVMQMQIKRQREFWHLLKIACVSNTMLLSSESVDTLLPSQHIQSYSPRLYGIIGCFATTILTQLHVSLGTKPNARSCKPECRDGLFTVNI